MKVRIKGGTLSAEKRNNLIHKLKNRKKGNQILNWGILRTGFKNATTHGKGILFFFIAR
jgi:hypothetical protein